MFGIKKILHSQVTKPTECLSLVTKIFGQRTLYAPSYFNIHKFDTHRNTIIKSQGFNKESVKATIQQSLSEGKDGRIFTEDLKVFLYLADSDEDYDLLIKSANKYSNQDESGVFNFKFGPPIMRAGYLLNKTDKMFDLYMNDEITFINDVVSVNGQILMNKLFEEKRYDDILKVFEKFLVRFTANLDQNKGEFNKVPNTSLQIAIEALLEKNDADSLAKIKEMFSKPNKLIQFNKHPSVGMILLAMNHNEYELAYKILNNFIENTTYQLYPDTRNIKVICLLKLGNTDEALVECRDILNQGNFRSKFFNETIDHLKEAGKKNPELSNQVDRLIEDIGDNLFMKYDIKNHYFQMQIHSPMEMKRMKEQKERGNFDFQGQNQNNDREQRSPFRAFNRDRRE